jgi:uncharacterized repeat protein (TIGR01451 family)
VDYAQVTVSDLAELSLVKTAAESSVVAGVTEVYTLTVSNAGPSAATQVRIEDPLPAGLSFVSGSSGCSETAGVVTCLIDQLPAQQTAAAVITVTVDLDVTGLLTNSAQVTADQPDTSTADNQASAVVEVLPSSIVYEDDFGTGPLDEWSFPITSTTPGGRTFLGEFNNQTVRLRLENLPLHSQVTLDFDLFVLRSWDGNQVNWEPSLLDLVPFEPDSIIGPDEWDLKADGGTLLHTTFSNWYSMDFPQAYPGPYPGGSYPAQTGAVEQSTLGYNYANISNMDSVYRMSFTFDHTTPSLDLDFAGLGLQSIADESWGLDNVTVRVTGGLDLKPYKLHLPLVAAR